MELNAANNNKMGSVGFERYVLTVNFFVTQQQISFQYSTWNLQFLSDKWDNMEKQNIFFNLHE